MKRQNPHFLKKKKKKKKKKKNEKYFRISTADFVIHHSKC